MPAGEPGGLDLFDRDQLLGGAPAKRAATLLFLIETRTARLSALARRRLHRVGPEAAEERALGFVEAFALARESAAAPTVYELERYAAGWSSLVPENARVRAAVARRIGEKHRFTATVAPRMVKALGLEAVEVRGAHQALYGEPLETLFAARLAPAERLRWAWTRLTSALENLPPFWIAYSLTLTETVGASILALPIALASLGPLPGLAILVALGLVNIVTVSLMAESVVRSGPMRYGNAFLGRLVGGYLGKTGGVGLTVLLAAFSFLALPVYYVGVGNTLEHATSVPAAIWVAALFLATILFLRRGSLDATIGAAVAVGAVNLALVVGLAVLGFAHANTSNLTHAQVPFTDGRPFESSVVAVILGVAFMGYFGHLSAALCGSLVLDRDPAGRSLVRGCAGAMATAAVFYCLFVLAVNGAVGPERLARATGTALEPLADVAGAGVDILGTAFVLLALGMISIIEAVSLFALAQERIPSLAPRVVVLPRQRGQLVFRGRRLRARLVYLGSGADGFRFGFDLERDGRLQRTKVVSSTRRDLLPPDRRHRLALAVLDGDEHRVRVAVTTTLRVAYEGELDRPGLDLTEALGLSDAEAALVAAIVRSGPVNAAAAAEGVGISEEETAAMLGRLAQRGLVEKSQAAGGPLFSARVAARRPRSSPVWERLSDDRRSGARAGHEDAVGTGSVAGLWALLLGRRGRFVLSMLPLVAAFALGEWFVITGAVSFTGLLSFLGLVVVSLLAGLLPVLLFVSSRRRGEYPSATAARLGHPVLLAAVYALFVTALLAHGLVIWDEPAQRVSALAVGVAMLGVPWILARGGAFSRRLTIELRDDQRDGKAWFRMASAGEPVPGHVRFDYGGDVRRSASVVGELPDLASVSSAVFEPRPDDAYRPHQLKVWAHRVTPEGESESLPAQVLLRSGEDVRTVDVGLTRGEALFDVDSSDLEIELRLKGLGAD